MSVLLPDDTSTVHPAGSEHNYLRGSGAADIGGSYPQVDALIRIRSRAACRCLQNRRARIMMPARWVPVSLPRGLVNAASDAYLDRNREVHGLVRRIEAESRSAVVALKGSVTARRRSR